MSRSRFQIFICLCALLLSNYVQQWVPSAIAPITHTLNDWRTRFAISLSAQYLNKISHPRREERIVIIDIDEKSLGEQGRWPWKRDKLAELLKLLIDEYGVSVVALDMVLPEADDGDAVLSQQLHRPEVTGAVVYDLLERGLPDIGLQLPETNLVSLGHKVPRFIGSPSKSNHQMIMPLRVGHITPIFDSDGSIRRLPPTICSKTTPEVCRPLLEILAFSSLIDGAQLSIEPVTHILGAAWEMKIKDPSNEVIAAIPLNQDGSIQVPYRHTKADWLPLSATDILNRRVNPKLTKGTVALVGSTALGMADVVSTPVSSESAGIEPHAEVLSALFDSSFMYEPRFAAAANVVFMLLLFVLLRLLQHVTARPLLQTMVYPVWLTLAWGLTTVVVMSCYMWGNLLLPVTPLFLFPLLIVLLSVLFEMYRVAVEKMGLFEVLSSYLPLQVAKHLSDSSQGKRGREHQIDASRREITVLFADIRGFTGLVENCNPETVAILMHKIFAEMAHAVVNHGGTIDKFIGDAVMAFWNAPDDDPEHAQNAYAAAQEMLQRIQGLADFCVSLGIEPVSIGIGIESGQTLVGHFGSGHRRTYTALGETVVLASRLEGLSAQYDQYVLIGQTCASKLNGVELRHLGEVNVRGRQRLINIYAPVRNSLLS